MNPIIQHLNNQLDKKYKALEIATFETLDSLDHVGLSMAINALDPQELVDAIEVLGDNLDLPADDELVYELARLQDAVYVYKLKSSGVRNYLKYRLDTFLK